MDIKLLAILRCPTCQGKLQCYADQTTTTGLIIEGKLECGNCSKHFPIINFIPRFVPLENYAASFGYQWNLYKYTQVDAYSKVSSSETRFFNETKWTAESMQDNWILEVGCGNGRFLDVCSRANCDVVGVDMSNAIDAAHELYANRPNVHLVQASIYELPFAKSTFDKCYSIGVIQHTPDPEKSIQTLPQFIKDQGQLALTIYEKKPWTYLYGKYLIRPLTKRINKKILLIIIKLISPILFPLTEILFRVPFISKLFKLMIPYANYVNLKALSIKQRYEWAILDTFDMLSPTYDKPMSEAEVRQCLEKIGIKKITRLENPGVNVLAYK